MPPEVATQRLIDFMERFGSKTLLEPKRCKALLMDIWGHKSIPQLEALMGAVDTGAVLKLFHDNNPSSNEALMRVLATELRSHRQLDIELAEWSIRVWAQSLEVAPSHRREVTMRRQPPSSSIAHLPLVPSENPYATASQIRAVSVLVTDLLAKPDAPVNPRLPLAQITKQLEAQQARGDEELDIFRHNFTNFAMAYGEAGRRGEVDEKYVAERQNHMLNDFMDRRSRGGAPLSAELERQFRDMIPKGSSRIHRLTRFIERLRKPQSPGNP